MGERLVSARTGLTPAPRVMERGSVLGGHTSGSVAKGSDRRGNRQQSRRSSVVLGPLGSLDSHHRRTLGPILQEDSALRLLA